MKCKVRLTHTVTMFVEGDTEDMIQDWLNSTTPSGAKKLCSNYVEEDYSEEIICEVRDDSNVDYKIN